MLFDLRKLAALTCAVAVAAPSVAWAGETAPHVTGERDRVARINETMGLTHSEVLRLDVTPGAPAPETLVLLINGAPMVVQLHEHSVRHDDYRVFAQVEDGSLIEVEPSPVNTYRGTIAGLPEARVSASMEQHGLHLRMVLPGGDEYWLEPLRQHLPDADADEHVLYNISHVLDCRGRCAKEEALRHQPFMWSAPDSSNDSQGGIAGGLKVAEIACDADFEYYQFWGSSVSNVQNRINSIINANNVLYEAQTGLTHAITTIIVRTSSNQPYTHKQAENLLIQFRNHWNTNHGNIQRDLAHLFTGKNLAGSVIGIAYLGVVCNVPWAYALSQSDFSSNFACVTDLTAHEIGHNWNAPHCNCPNHTMNSWITCANNFHSSSINTIVQFANSLTCLDGDGGPDPDENGACCQADGSCFDNRTESQCIQTGGTFLGIGTTCAQCPTGPCPTGEIEDCNGNCAPESWVGDGICDDGSWTYNGVPIYFNCDEFDCDGGDCVCDDDPGDPDPPDDPDPPADPTSMNVASITVTTFNAGQGRHKGQAVVTIVNDLGQPVQGATVTGTFSSPYNETHSAVTNAQGQATLQTDGHKQGGNVNFTFCVTNVTGDLDYAPGDNAVTCAP